ncbi:MAG: DNA-binding response regulator [Dehalococcoidia bacterium]|nr:DNA-binding response regulator [Dehalococcoidia bacterium]
MKVLLVDDDPDILEVVSLCFEIRWPDAIILKAQDGTTGIDLFEKQGADIVILDLGLPDIDGLEVCKTLRSSSNVPIIILTVRDQPKDIVRGLEIGADDYITKPFDQLEFLARAQAVLRRSQGLTDQDEAVFDNGELAINFTLREVRLRGEVVKLTPTEYNLLYHWCPC